MVIFQFSSGFYSQASIISFGYFAAGVEEIREPALLEFLQTEGFGYRGQFNG